MTDYEKLIHMFKEYRVEFTEENAQQLAWQIDNNYCMLYNIEGKLTIVERFISIKPYEY